MTIEDLFYALRAVPASVGMLVFAAVAYGLCSRVLLKGRPVLERILGAWVVGHALASSGVHVHFLLGGHSTLFFWGLLAGAGGGLFWKRKTLAADLLQDRDEVMLASSRVPGWRKGLLLVVGGWILLVSLRALFLPPLAWDSLTYHYVKPALWLQSGMLDPLGASGGWSFYRLFPGLWESLLFWPMFFMQGDALVPLVDVVAWWALGGSVLLLQQRLGVPRVYHLVVAIVCMSLPCVWRLVGSGYNENGFAALLLVAIAFAFPDRKNPKYHAPFLAAVALGLAAGYKLFNLPLIAWVGVLLVVALWVRRNSSGFVRPMARVVVGFVLMAVPWFIYTWQMTGAPLSPVPVGVLGVTLGETVPAIDWYLDRPGIQAYEGHAEWSVIRDLFVSPWSDGLGFGWLGPVLLGVGLLGGVRGFQKGGTPRLLGMCMFGVVAINLILFFGPSFSVNRHTWPETNVRFLLPAMLAVLVSLGRAFGEHQARPVVVGLAVIVAFNGLPFVGWGWSPVEWGLLPAVLVGIGVFFYLGRRRSGRVLLLLLVVGMPLLVLVKTQLRYKLLAESTMVHGVQKYWLPAAYQVAEHAAIVVAVTTPPWQNGDNQCWYYFLGDRLQHRLVAVPYAGRTLPESAKFHLHLFPADPEREPPGGWQVLMQSERPPWRFETRP